MDERIIIGKFGAIYYTECFDCGTPKSTRYQRQAKLCKSCSGKRNKLADTDSPTRVCKVCEKTFAATNENFRWANRKKGRLDRTCKECCNARNKQWRAENADLLRQKRRAYRAKRRQTDTCYRLAKNVSCCVRKALNKQHANKVGQSTFAYLPYTPEQLKEHLQSQFDEHMTWDNYGDYWHIDHIYPQSLLPYDNLEHPNFQKCWALDNLQPLEASENIRKSNTLPPSEKPKERPSMGFNMEKSNDK